MGAPALLALSLAALGCERVKQPTAQTSADPQKGQDDDRLFQKRLECGNLLARMEGSTLGPPVHHEQGVLAGNPVVFYSPNLNTCVHVMNFITRGKTVAPPVRSFRERHIFVEDLLSGRSLEERHFDLSVPQEATAASNYEDEVVRRYGGRVP